MMEKVLKIAIEKIANSLIQEPVVTNELSYTGVWTTSFDTVFFPGYKAKEVYFFKQSGRKVIVHIQHYSERNPATVSFLTGRGIIKNSKIAMYYESDRIDSDVCGVMYLSRVRTELEDYILSGNVIEDFTLLDQNRKENLARQWCGDDYIKLKKLNLSLWQRISVYLRFQFRFKAYRNFDEVPI